MNTSEILGHKIKDILVWSKIDVGGLDEAEVFIELDNGKMINIPWGLGSENLESVPPKDSNSLFSDLNDMPVYSVNLKNQTIAEIVDKKGKRDLSLFGRIRNVLGFREVVPKEYESYSTEYLENKIKCLQNQKITNCVVFNESDNKGFLELENGYLITETTVAPHGTGLAGLNCFENIVELEIRFGKNYSKLKE